MSRPLLEVHVMELISQGTASREAMLSSDAGEVLDRQAKDSYRRRVQELRAEIDEAESFHDSGRAEAARSEMELLLQELRGAVGLGGSDRRLGSAPERARINVTRAIALAMKKISEHHPSRAEHFRNALRTGTFCLYAPDPRAPIDWEI